MLSQPYKNLIGRCAVLFSAGTALQFLVGPVNPSFLAYPWGIVLAVNYLYVLILLYCQADKWKWVKKWYDRPACIVSLVSLLILTLFFGLIRQDASTDGLGGMLGFTDMTSSWIFNFFLIHFMTVMGFKSIDDVWHWKKRNPSRTFRWKASTVMSARRCLIRIPSSARLTSCCNSSAQCVCNTATPLVNWIWAAVTVCDTPMTTPPLILQTTFGRWQCTSKMHVHS